MPLTRADGSPQVVEELRRQGRLTLAVALATLVVAVATLIVAVLR